MAISKYYLTKAGLKRIEDEYEKLLTLKKSKVTGDNVPATWESEDVNPDYLAYQEDMTLLDAKMLEYEDILKNAEIIKKPAKKDQETIQLGAIVSIDFDGEIDEFTIVGTLEANPAERKISNESPIGQGLIGKKAGEVVVVKASVVNHSCQILKVRYSS